MLRLEGDNAVTEDFGVVDGLNLWASAKLPNNVSLQQAQDPNFLFKVRFESHP